MKIENLTPTQTGSIETLLRTMQDSNPHLSWEVFQMGAEPHPIHHEDPRNPKGTTRFDEVDKALFLGDDYLTPVEERLDVLEDKIDRILNRLDLVFGPHVLMNGQFVNLKLPHNET